MTRIPSGMIVDALASAPSRVVLYGRDDEHDLTLEGRRVSMGTGGAALKVIDVGATEPRKATLGDLARLARLVDALDNIDFFLRPVVAQDIPREVLDVNKYYACLANTTKHVMGSAYTKESFQEVKELGAMMAGSLDSLRERPFLSFISCWTRSPLTFYAPTTEVMMEIVKEGLPVVLSSAPMAGATSPVTLAGSLVQLHAEILSGLTLTQLINPGAPVIAGYVPSIANPLTMDYLGGAAEFGLLNAAAVQLAGHFGMPNYSSAGLTESKMPDQQAGIEKAITLLQVAMAGGNYIHHAAGMLESMLTVSYAQYVIDDDLLGMVQRVLRGIRMDDEALGFDIISKVGADGTYVTQKHSAKNVRKEYVFPKTMDRRSRKDWVERGSMDNWQRADQRAREILDAQAPLTVGDEIDREVRRRFDIRNWQVP
jgi:trimethylamine--corrinoid protein Co-methyltransferase